MPRPRITEEQAIERYGSLEKYEAHLANMSKWHRDHAEEQREYRWKNRDRERARAMKWRAQHPEQVDKIKANHKAKRQADPEFAKSLNTRTRSRYLAGKLEIDRTGCEIHHFTDPLEVGNFIVLARDKHKWLHNTFGGRNKKIDLKVIKAVLPMLGDVVLVLDGRIARWDEV